MLPRLPVRALAAICLAVASLSTSDAAAEDVVVSNWRGYMAPDAAEAFAAETGHVLRSVIHASNEELMGKLISGQGAGLDVVFVTSTFAQALQKLDLAEPLDHSRLPNLINLYPEATALKHDPANSYSVPYAWGTTGLCYRSDLIAAPTGWRDLLDPAPGLEGRVTMLATDRWLLAAGQLANGFSVNTTDPQELRSVRDDLIAARGRIRGYDNTTFYARLVSGETWMAQSWDGWCNYGTAENPDIAFMIPPEGSDLWVDTMVILRSAPHKEAAYAFVNWMLEPENGAWVAETILYKVPNRAAMETLDPALIERFPNLGMPPAELTANEQILDVGSAVRSYARIVAEIRAE